MKRSIISTFLCSVTLALGAPIEIGNPKVELETNPTGVSTTPRFSWTLKTDEQSKRQSGFHLIAASSEDLLNLEKADLWNSGLIKNGQRHLVPWQGKALKDGQKVFWKVRVNDESGAEGNWSPAAHFTVGGEKKFTAPFRTSGFESSSETLNQLYQDGISHLQDRIEKFAQGDTSALGTGAELQRSAREYLYHFDSAPHLTEWLRLMDAQRTPEGFFPTQPGAPNFGSVSSDAGITVNYPVWWMSGDSDFVKGRWEIFEKYFMAREKLDPKFKGSKWGQGFEEPGISHEYFDLCSMAYAVRFVRELATPAQQPLNAIRFQDYASSIRVSFASQYLDNEGALKPDSQTAQLLALRCAVLPEDGKGHKIEKNQTLVIKDLLASLSKNGPRVGPTGAHLLLPVLALTGHQNDAVKVLSTLTPEQRPHFIGTGATEWMMSYLAGLDSSAPGFQQIRIAPMIPTDGSVSWVKAHYDSPAGRIDIHWDKLADKGLKIILTIPAGTLAQVFLPMAEGQTLTESGKTIQETPGVEIAQQSNSQVSLITQSGKFSFEIK